MKSAPLLLIFPPGWGLNVGGPHIALPLLKGFLESRNVPVEIWDLNIASSEYYGVRINEFDVFQACERPNLSNLNNAYLCAQKKLDFIANLYQGHWDIQLGFNNSGCDPASSESIRIFSDKISPFSQIYCSQVIPFILKEEPPLIGFSITVPSQLLPTFELCKLLRKTGYQGKIILGGNVITRLGDKIFLDWVFELVNGVVLFQGELGLLGIWKALQNQQNFGNIPNLCWKNNGQLVFNKVSVLDASDFLGPDFCGLHLDQYWGISYLPIVGSRGCYYNQCTFCSIPYGWGNNGFIGHSNPHDIFNDIKRSCDQFYINRFKFVEEALHPFILKNLVSLINRESFSCSFEGYGRFDPLWSDLNFLNKATKAGLKKVYLGLEIYPSKSRSLLNKSDSAPIIETLAKLFESGIKTHLFLMFGYPGTGVDEALSSIDFVLKYRNLIDTLDIFPFCYAKHTKVGLIESVFNPTRDWALEYDYIPKAKGVLSHDQVIELSNQLEDLIWKENPVWLHPIYRMYSPWGDSVDTVRQSSHHYFY